MTTLIMPSDYGMEMLVGSSPIVGSGFLSGSPFCSDYSRRSPVWSSGPVSCSTESVTTIPAKRLSCPTFPYNVFSEVAQRTPITTASVTSFIRAGSARNVFRESGRRRKPSTITPPQLQNLKSCIISRPEEQLECLGGLISPTREKKKVSFADTNGLDLTQIKIITERPDCPPRWSHEFLEQVTGGAKAEAVPTQWELTFAQPSSNYMKWKGRLERDNVALENIIIKETEGVVSGTIKVRNLSYHKEVKVRFTSTSWMQHEDVDAIFVSSLTVCSSYNIYDTFTFAFPLPLSTAADKVEFCVQFISDDGHFWDNNDNKNYTLVSFRSKNSNSSKNEKPTDLYDLKMDSWSEFSAWQHLESNQSPYW